MIRYYADYTAKGGYGPSGLMGAVAPLHARSEAEARIQALDVFVAHGDNGPVTLYKRVDDERTDLITFSKGTKWQ